MQVASSHPTHLLPPVMMRCSRQVSPLMLADRLITLAEDADRSGHCAVAATLIGLAYTVLDE